MILTKEVFAASHAKTLISAKIRFFAPPLIEQNFYFVQLSIDFKMPLSIGSFIENRRTADQRHVRCASRSKDQSLRSFALRRV